MGSKKKTKSTSQQTATTQQNVPEWLLTPYQTAASNVATLQNTPASTYTPTSTPELDRSWADVGNLKTPDYSGATGLLDGVNYDIAGSKGADFSGIYRDLFNKDVTDPVLADFDENAGQVRAAQAADGARNGAFRGGRFGLREGQTEGELARGRAATHGGLLRDAANFAMQGGQTDAARAQAAAEGNRGARFTGAGLLSDITGRAGADQRTTLDMKNRVASQQTDFQNMIKQFPLELQGKLNGLLQGLDLSQFTGQTINSSGSGTSTQSGGFLGDFLLALAGGAHQAAASAAAGSDRSIKRDIEDHHVDDKGRRWVSFNYVWDEPDEPKRIGVIAQEVRETDPDAVSVHPLGFLQVDYGKLT